jgi:hypothetical protein
LWCNAGNVVRAAPSPPSSPSCDGPVELRVEID